MDTRTTQFNRNLLVVMVVLYLLSLAGFSYFNWIVERDMQWWQLLLNIPILSIPLVLLYGSIYVLVVAWRAHRAGDEISPGLARIIRLAPRLAAILIILFLGLFSLDVFEMQATPLELLGGFLIHNIPSIALLVLLFFAWKRPVVGFVAFLAAAVIFTAFFVRGLDALPTFVLIVLPILLVASLFYADWQWLPPQRPAGSNTPA